MKTKTAHLVYAGLIIILVVLTVLSGKTAIFSTEQSTPKDLYLAAFAIGGSALLWVYGLVLLILGVAKKRGLRHFMSILVSVVFLGGLGAANFILFFLILGFTGSG